jgi:hypothetical protein
MDEDMGFEAFSTFNAAAMEQDYMIGKKPAKAQKAPKPPKPPRASNVHATRKLLEKKKHDDTYEERYSKLRKINKMKQYFGGRLTGKTQSSQQEMEEQLRDMCVELDGANSVPATKECFKMLVDGLEKYSPYGNLTGISKLVRDPDVFKQNFDDPLTRVAIEYSLFDTGPLTTLAFNLAAMIIAVHQANVTGQTFGNQAPPETASDKYASL